MVLPRTMYGEDRGCEKDDDDRYMDTCSLQFYSPSASYSYSMHYLFSLASSGALRLSLRRLRSGIYYLRYARKEVRHSNLSERWRSFGVKDARHQIGRIGI